MSINTAPVPHNQFTLRDVVTDTTPVAMGYIPLGAAYGLLMVDAGFAWFWPALMSLIVFAGALQFLSVSFLLAGMPLWEVALTTLIINFRHIFYGFSYPIEKVTHPLIKLYGMFCLSDETYSLLASQDRTKLTEKRIFLIQLFCHGYWVVGSLIGALASMLIPTSINGIEFALTALFVVLAQEHCYKKDNHPAILLGFAAAMVAFFIPTSQFLTIAMAIFVVVLTIKFQREVNKEVNGKK